MRWLTLFFISMQFFYLFNTRQLYALMDSYTKFLKEKHDNPDKKYALVLDSSSIFFLIYMIADFSYLIFCLYLLIGDAYWQQGGMLFILTALESYAYHAKVDYTYVEDPEGFSYPSAWCRCLFGGASLFILTRLYAML